MTEARRSHDLAEALAVAEGRVEALEAEVRATQGVLDAISEAIYLQDAQGRFLVVNEGAARMYGYPTAFFIGKTPEVISAPQGNDLTLVGECFQKAMEGTPQVFEFWGRRANGEVFPKEVRLYPGTHLGEPVVIAVAQDISGRKRAEALQQATYQLAEAALQSRNIQDLLPKIHGIVRGLMPAENFYVALWDRASDTVSFPYWVDDHDPAPAPRRSKRGLTELVLRTGEPQLITELSMPALVASGQIESFGSLSLDWLGVPLGGEAGVFGALVVQSYEGGHRYSDAARDLLAFVSSQVAMAIGRTRAQAQQRLMTAAMDHAIDPVFGMDEGGRLVFVNQAACISLGYARADLLNLHVWEVDPSVPEASWATRWDRLRKVGANREETLHRRRDGSIFPVEISSTFLPSEGREVVFTHARDITGRKAAEAALRLSEDKFSRAFHASPDAINLTRLNDGTYLDVSQGFEAISGWSREEVLGRTALELHIWGDPADRQRAVELIHQHGEYKGLEVTFRRKDGSLLTGLMSGKIIDVDGVPCLLTVTQDISARKASEAALHLAEQRLRTVLAHSQAIIYQLDAQGRFLLSEGLGLANLGLKPGQVVGMNALEVYKEDAATVNQMQRALSGEASRETTQAGGRRFDNFLTPVFDLEGKLESVIGIATDVTAQYQTQQALLAERNLFTGGPVMVIRWRNSPGWPVDYLSPNAQDILGYPAEAFTSGQLDFQALIHPEDAPRIRQEGSLQRQQGTSHYKQEYRLRHADGTYRWIYDFTGAGGPLPDPPYFLGYLLDITEQRQTQEVLRQAQKLESLGLLAGGIAHDFNNLLTAVLGNLNLAQMHLPEASPAAVYLGRMEAAVLRATDLTKQMLAYSGRGHFQVKPQDLNQVVRDVTHLLEVSIPKKVRLRLNLEDGLPAIHADGTQVQQVIMNLVTNAADAIGDAEGIIQLTSGSAFLEARELQVTYDTESLAAGPYVLLEVTDTGCGMPPEVLARIFDPFFTTKVAGRGLGLSAMLGILRGHGAGLQIRSEVGRGSSFRLCFPASEGRVDPPAQPPAEEAPEQLRGLILLVDDEPAILQTLASALQSFGLDVITAQDGQEALDRFRTSVPKPDMVLMDLTMPRMDGREAFLAMQVLDPTIPVVLSSGYTAQDSMQTFGGEGPREFIQKPYQIQALRNMVLRVLRS